MNKQITVYLSISFSMIFWSISFVWSKVALETYQPVTIIFFRLIISSAFLWILFKILKLLQPLEKKDIKHFLLLVLFQPFLYFIGESYGLLYVSPTTASVIVSTIPLFTPFAAVFLLKEKISLMNIAGILLSIFGIYLVIAVNGLSLNVPFVGIALLFLAVFAAVGYAVVLKKLAGKYNPVTIITYQNLFGVFYFLPVFFFVDYNHFINANHNNDAILSIVFLAVFASSFAYILYIYGVQKLGVIRSMVFVNIIPVFTIIFSFFLIGEEITLQKILGIFIVFAGVMISQLSGKRLARRKA